MIKIQIEESKLLMEHAVESCKGNNITQKKLASLIDIEESRISDAKKGKYRLHSTTEKAIIDMFGYPKRASGQYVIAELYNSLDHFIGEYTNSSDIRYINRLHKLFNRKDYQNILLSNIISFADKLKCTEDMERQANLEKIEKMLSLDTFKAWVKSNKSIEINRYNCIDINNDILIEAGFETLEKGMLQDRRLLSIALFRLAIFKYELSPNFSFSRPKIPHNIDKHQIVLTGSIVYKDWLDSKQCDNQLNLVAHIHKNHLIFPEFPTEGTLPPYTEEIDQKNKILCKPDCWSKANVKLYLTGKMEYNLWIQLVDQPFDMELLTALREDEEEAGLEIGAMDEEISINTRNIVISNLNRGSIFNELERLRKWLGLPADFNEEVKRKVAQQGGYIPGARVL